MAGAGAVGEEVTRTSVRRPRPVGTHRPGAVLVIDGAGFLRRAVMGDMIAALAVENGWSGVVIHGAVRDVAVPRTLPLGVKALGSNPRTSTKTSQESVDVPVEFGDVTLRPAARLVADADGVLVER